MPLITPEEAKPRSILGIDFETTSHCEIKRGSAAYAEHPTTRAMCAVFILSRHTQVAPSLETCEVEQFKFEWWPGMPVPHTVVEWIKDGGAVLAHNISFEHEIIKAGHIKGLPLPKMEQWHDTMAIAASLNLPQSLGGLTETLQTHTEKSKAGYKVMMKCCKLDADGKHINTITQQDKVELMSYCVDDVASMIDAYAAMPGMQPSERETWVADAKMNNRGVPVDIEFTTALAHLARSRKHQMNKSAQKRSATLMSAAQDNQLKRIIKESGVELPKRTRATGKVSESLDADACEELLGIAGLADDLREFLEARRESGKLTSLSKLSALDNMKTADDRLRWQFRFCGASQTGRWSAKGLQLHNTPKDRRGPEHTKLVRQVVRSFDYEMLCALEPNVLEALSLCLRGMVIAPVGFDLIAADYSAIEARVLPWLCFFEEKLQLFRNGIDTYVKAAADVGSTNRSLGKVQELGLGFGMGVPKFADTATKWGVPLELKDARRIQKGWREANLPIKEFWSELAKTAMDLIKGKPNRAAPVGRCIMRRVSDRLVVELPSGRQLNYWQPKIMKAVRKFDYVTEAGDIESDTSEIDVIKFWGPGKRGFMEIKETYGGKLCENVTQACARDLLAHALVKVDEAPVYEPLIHMHDSLAALVREGRGNVQEFEQLLTDAPEWAAGLPVAAEGYRARYYKG